MDSAEAQQHGSIKHDTAGPENSRRLSVAIISSSDIY